MFHIVAVNLYGEVMATETIELPYVNSDTYYTSLAENVETFILNRQYEPEKIEGISIATQGIISPDGTAVIYGDIMGFLIFLPDCHTPVTWNMIPNQLQI